MRTKPCHFEILAVLLLSFIPWPGPSVFKISCPRDRASVVRKIVQKRWIPILKKYHVELPLECPFHASRDIFYPQQAAKFQHRTSQWTCGLCGKSFYAEKHLDAHFDSRHRSDVNTAEDAVCLANYCDIMRCDVLGGNDLDDSLTEDGASGMSNTDIQVWRESGVSDVVSSEGGRGRGSSGSFGSCECRRDVARLRKYSDKSDIIPAIASYTSYANARPQQRHHQRNRKSKKNKNNYRRDSGGKSRCERRSLNGRGDGTKSREKIGENVKESGGGGGTFTLNSPKILSVSTLSSTTPSTSASMPLTAAPSRTYANNGHENERNECTGNGSSVDEDEEENNDDDENDDDEDDGDDDDEDEEDDDEEANYYFVESSLPVPLDKRERNKEFEIRKLKSNCRPEELEKLKIQCQILVRDCIAGLLANLSVKDFQEIEGELNRAICWYLSCDKYWEDSRRQPRHTPWYLLITFLLVLSTGISACYYIISIILGPGDDGVMDRNDENHDPREIAAHTVVDRSLLHDPGGMDGRQEDRRRIEIGEDRLQVTGTGDMPDHYIYVAYPPELKRRLLESCYNRTTRL